MINLLSLLSPADLGLNGVNLKDDSAPYKSGFVNLQDHRQFMASLIVENTGGGAAGAASLAVEIYDDDKATVLGTIDLLTAIGLTTDRTELVTFGRGLTPTNSGNGTIGAAIGVLKVLRWVKFVITVNTESDATTCLGYLRLFQGN